MVKNFNHNPNFFGNMQKDLHATTFPNMCLFVTLDKNCSNLILKILETIAGQPRTFKCISSSNLCISDQHGLHVKVTNNSKNEFQGINIPLLKIFFNLISWLSITYSLLVIWNNRSCNCIISSVNVLE